MECTDWARLRCKCATAAASPTAIWLAACLRLIAQFSTQRNLPTFSFQDSLRMATLNPARVLRIDHRKGLLRAGADADIVVFSPAGEVRQAIVGGIFN